jgi:Peptidase_C39 like family
VVPPVVTEVLFVKRILLLLTLLAMAGVVLLGQEQRDRQAPVVVRAVYASAGGSSTQLSQVAGPVVRIPQLQRDLYASQALYEDYAYAACSSAAMAEVMNAYGAHVSLDAALKEEIALHEITPDLGMLNGEQSIARTVAHFGFQAHALTSSSLAEVINVAAKGHPVIVGFPPDRWNGGHLLVVRGGDSQYVYLVDSSRLNMQAMSYATFLNYWVGFAVVVTPAGKGGAQ